MPESFSDISKDPSEFVINLRNEECHPSLRDQIIAGLTGTSILGTMQKAGNASVHYSKTLPTTILYEDEGIKLYDAITRDVHYYLYREELSIIQKYGEEMAATILGLDDNAAQKTRAKASFDAGERSMRICSSHTLLVDLGAGRLDKAQNLLQATVRVMDSSKAAKYVSATYCAIDIQHEWLKNQLLELARANPSFQIGCHHRNAAHRDGKVALRGACGTYQQAMSLLQNDVLIKDTPPFDQEGDHTTHRKCLLWLGSSLSNTTPADAAIFLGKFANEAILRPGDMLLIGLDRCRDSEKVQAAYSEQSSCWKKYIRNGIKNSGAALGTEAMQYLDGGDNWDYVSYWSSEEGRHMRFVKAKEHCTFEVKAIQRGISSQTKRIAIKKNELILMAQSYKYTTEDILQVFLTAN